MVVEKVFEYFVDNPRYIVFGLIIYSTLYLISRLYSRPRAGKNPFDKDYRRLKEPMVVESKLRSSILKQRFELDKVPDNLDTIVIGSGSGGLTTALLLARAGQNVVVLEQQKKAGGCCHTFVEKGYEFDTGIHYIGQMEHNSTSRIFLDQLTEGQLEFAPMHDSFDEIAVGCPENVRKFSMRSGHEKYYDNLIQMFPKEEAGIRKYQKLEMYSSKTLQQVLDELTTSQDLKFVLSYICGDYGVLPKDVPFLLHASLTAHYKNGAFYPIGGPSEITYQLVRNIERHGGKVFVRAPVSEILCDASGKAIGVRVKRTSGDVCLTAKRVVSTAGAINTFDQLLPPSVASKSCIKQVIDKVGPSMSFITTFVGVDGSQDDLKLPSGNTWYYSSIDINKDMSTFTNLDICDLSSSDIPLCYISFPSAKDPTYAQRHNGKSAVLIITLARWDWFSNWSEERVKHRGEDYESFKNSLGERMWKVCSQLFPQLEGKREYMEVGTPVTNKYYLAYSFGEMYGLAQSQSRFSPQAVACLRPDTDVPGLFLAGQDVLMCGFTSALYTGLMCASHILYRNLWKDFNAIRLQVKRQSLTDKSD